MNFSNRWSSSDHPWLSSTVAVLVVTFLFWLLVNRLGDVKARCSDRSGLGRLDVVLQADGSFPSKNPARTNRRHQSASQI